MIYTCVQSVKKSYWQVIVIGNTKHKTSHYVWTIMEKGKTLIACECTLFHADVALGIFRVKNHIPFHRSQQEEEA